MQLDIKVKDVVVDTCTKPQKRVIHEEPNIECKQKSSVFVPKVIPFTASGQPSRL